MKLIKEISQELEYITEDVNSSGKKSTYIRGPFMQAEKANRNGRMYPKGTLEKEVERYQNMISEKRSLGELGHPPNPTVNLNQVSHLITRLDWDGNNVIGEAKILDTPMGKIAKNFIEEGVRLGVSSRGVGSLSEGKDGIKIVQPDFHLATVDIVADPSAPDAFVEGIMENAEWICNNGIWTQVQIDQAREQFKKVPSARLEEEKLKLFEKFLAKIK
jgi:hypothetical protein